MARTALITGITGQDGSYLAELLLAKGYTVYGLVRRTSTLNLERIDHLLQDLRLLQADLTDQGSLMRALQTAAPDEVYNLAAMSHVGTSFQEPAWTMMVNGIGCLNLLECMRLSAASTRFYQASTSEIVGQENQTTFLPKSPYATSKLYAHWSTVNYREAYRVYACSGILYNHESPRRGLDFVTRKITRGVARIAAGLQDTIALGNMSAYRDWGYAPDYVKAMWLMLQQEKPRDYVVATGYSHSVAEFARLCFEYVGIKDWMSRIIIDTSLYRNNEVQTLVGDPSEARQLLGWSPSVNFYELVAIMMEAELATIKGGNQHARAFESVH